MKNYLCTCFWVLASICIFGQNKLLAQQKYTISGYIKDAGSGEGLIGATALAKETKTGVAANVYGFYSLTLPEGSYTISYSFLGYQTVEKQINLTANQTIAIELGQSANELSEVVIESDRPDQNVKSMEMSVAKLDIKTIQKMPALLGEVDVVRSIQLLPGVSTVGEGASGFNVRGGSIDHNLILLDEAPVYNSSHLFGFFSVFNPDAVKDVKLQKGGIPAQYGGRLASLLDVRMKEGNNKRWTGQGGVGTIFSRFTLEGPIIKDKLSVIGAVRRSYGDVFLKLSNNDNLKQSILYFYDASAKVNWNINAKNKVFASGYFGRDVFGFSSLFGFNWGNRTGSVRWNHVFSPKLFSNITAFYSNYDYQIAIEDKKDGFSWKSNIINYSIKPDFTYYLNSQNTLTFGGQAIYYTFRPGDVKVKSEGINRNFMLPEKYAMENALFAGNEQEINERLSIQYGLRLSIYDYLGKGQARTYTDTLPNVRRQLATITNYEQNQTIKRYPNLEPRFSVKYSLDDASSLKLGYNRMFQYVHLISNTTASTPLDVWTGSTNNIPPQRADQLSVGYFRNFGAGNDYETSAEVYYKDMQNQIDYIDGADLNFNPNLEAELMFGKGRAYGLELYLKKNTGKLTGWISYTLAKTERQVEGINLGKWFPTRFDKRHNLSMVGIYELNTRWSFSSNFTFGSGTPATFPTNRIELGGFVSGTIPHNSFESRNNYRIPAYHRLDLSATYEGKPRPNRRWDGNWVFSIYNVYNRRNPFSVFFRVNETNPQINEAVRFAVFGSIIPSVTYNFKF